MTRNFESWETQDLEDIFGLKRVFGKYELLDTWLNNRLESTNSEEESIKKVQDRLLRYADYWNEDELKMQGISKIIDIVDYFSETHSIFSQRPLTAKINDIELTGRVDFMIARGSQKPKEPYFFIHEYKQESKRASSDPKGQLLSELLAAQHKNEGKFPMYGCYVVGRNWFFVILNGKEYAVSDANHGLFVRTISETNSRVDVLRVILHPHVQRIASQAGQHQSVVRGVVIGKTGWELGPVRRPVFPTGAQIQS